MSAVFTEKGEARAERGTKPIGEAAVQDEVNGSIDGHETVGEVVADENGR